MIICKSRYFECQTNGNEIFSGHFLHFWCVVVDVICIGVAGTSLRLASSSHIYKTKQNNAFWFYNVQLHTENSTIPLLFNQKKNLQPNGLISIAITISTTCIFYSYKKISSENNMEEFVERISAKLFVCKFGNTSRWLSRTRNEKSSRIRYSNR